jgi:cytochrome P450
LTGEKVRIHPNGILINSASAYRAIYGHKANVKRGDFYYITARKTHIASTLSTVDKDKHARKRRILNRVFSDTAIRSAEGFIVKHVDRWCDLLVDNDSKDWSPPKNAATLLQGLIFDIIGDLAVGKSFDIKEPVENPLKAVPAILTAFVKLVYPVSRVPCQRGRH